ncbi:MAG TPA: CHASE2 domain-containing protein [Vicinamibacterales bacterium]|jgi:adenylate cyclase
MIARSRALVLLCGLIPTAAAGVMSLYRPALLRNLEYSVYDVLVRATPARPPDSQVVIVDIDERSLSAVGQWPWRRNVVGTLISNLRDLGASVIALDIVFAESDRLQGSTDDTDASLAETLRAGKVVLGYALTFDATTMKASACVQYPIGLAIVRRGDDGAQSPFFHATGSICSLPMLTRAAGASGYLNAAPDPDGILRRVPLLLELDDQVYPALSLAAVAALKRPQEIALSVTNVNASTLVLDNQAVPLDGKSNLLVRFRGAKRTFPYVSAADVMSGVATPAMFKDKIVFVGTTALGTREVVATPLDTLFAGVEVQATVADNLLQRDFFRRAEYGVTLETQLVLALGIAVTLVAGRFGLIWGWSAVAAAVVIAWSMARWQLVTTGAFFSPLYPTLGLTGALFTMTAARFATERRRANRAVLEKATSQRLMVQSLLSLTEVRDMETGRHSRRTQRYTKVLAEQLAKDATYSAYLTPENIELLSSLAPLHDIGKVGVPDRLLNKPGELTTEELAEMRKHPAHGRDVIAHAEDDVGTHDDLIMTMAKDIVYTHHEKWDGSGYPEGLRGTQIPIAGRLIALVDVYDAVRTRRLYRQPLSHDEAVALIRRGRGTHFDPAVVDAFLAVSPILESLSADSSLAAAR